MLRSAMPSLCRVLVPEVLPAPPPQLVLPSRVPADLPPEGRAVLAAAGPLPPGQGNE